nr:EOG090X087A [Ilyocryptus agilis]
MVLQDFNPGKFVVYLSLLVFVALLSLRLDGVIKTCYWGVFAPLWIWKLLSVIGAAVGSFTWWKRPSSRMDPESYIHFKSMLLSLSLHLLLLFFEVLACDKLESGRHIWVLVFLPLLFLSVVCIAVSIWALKHERPFEIELFGAVNLLQLIFIALRLDGFILWRWELVFIPLWIIFGAALMGVLYTILLAAVFSRSRNISSEQRRGSSNAALGYAALVVPSLTSQILLTKRLDGDLDLPLSIIVAPFLMALISLVLRSFSARGGNFWWCGMQKDFFSFLLELFPALREYGNVSYRYQESTQRALYPEGRDLSPNLLRQATPESKIRNMRSDCRTVVPILSIDIPD